MHEFFSEDDLQTFEWWVKYQQYDASTMPPEELATLRRLYDEARERTAAIPKVGLMKLQRGPGEHLYAVAVQEGQNLWLTMWVRCSRKGEFFIMMPRGDREWDAHASYHQDGTLHMKSHDRKLLPPQKRKALTSAFRGSEHLGCYYGHAPKSVGAICDPAAFSGVIRVAPNVLGLNQGGVTVDLVEPRQEPTEFPWGRIVTRQVFRDITPWVVITVGR